MPANLENSVVATGLERSVLIPIPNKGKAKECSNYHTIGFISQASKAMLKILQVRLQQYVTQTSRCLNWIQKRQRNQRSNCQHLLLGHFSCVRLFATPQRAVHQAPPSLGFSNICWIMVKARECQKNINFCFIDYAKAFDCVDHNKLQNSSRDGNTRPPDLPPEKSVCRSRSNRQNWTWNNRLVPNQERSTSRLYIVTLLI